MNKEVKFIFHSVGQGLFYTGEINTLNIPKIETFNFVYDCGSKNEKFLEESIAFYKNHELKNNDIDLLIISHFHDDHINGLLSLLDGVKVKTVVMPYLYPTVRHILAALDFPKEYHDFLKDPVFFLIEKKMVEKIIIIGGGEGKQEPFPIGNNNPKSDENIDKLMEEDKNLKKDILEKDGGWEKYIGKGKLTIKKHEGYIIQSDIWLLRFFNYNIQKEKLEEFEKCLSLKNVKFSSIDSLKSMLKDRKSKESIMECYKKISSELNNSSLVVFHGPIGEYYGRFSYYCKPLLYHCSYMCCCRLLKQRKHFYCEDKNMGQFLTGDISLKFKYKQLKDHYLNYFNRISLSQVPHHGAKGNWKKEIFNELKNCNLWCSSSGFSNRYGHPNISVMLDILKNRSCFCLSNELNKIVIEGNIRSKPIIRKL